jgi:hypothetical protein
MQESTAAQEAENEMLQGVLAEEQTEMPGEELPPPPEGV